MDVYALVNWWMSTLLPLVDVHALVHALAGRRLKFGGFSPGRNVVDVAEGGYDIDGNTIGQPQRSWSDFERIKST